MIASVTGTVQVIDLSTTVITVGGVGMAIHATPTTLAGLRVGQEATLATSLVVREDSLTLFGFADVEEKVSFEVLLTVSGVGPRLAMAMLAVHTPSALANAVAQEDLAALQRVPGIGKKSAQRIVLEVGERLGPATDQPGAQHDFAAAANPEVTDALVNLGWSQSQAEKAVAAVGEGADTTDVSHLLRLALQQLGGQRG